MKIALPTRDNMVDGHFGHCEYFTVFTVDDGKILSQDRVEPQPGCGCKSEIVPQLADLGVKLMLAGNMGEGAVQKLNYYGIDVVRGCSGEVKSVMDKWLSGEISDSGTSCSQHGEGHDHDHSCGHH